MVNYKRKGPRTMKNRCMCKYWKHRAFKGTGTAQTRAERRAITDY